MATAQFRMVIVLLGKPRDLGQKGKSGSKVIKV